MNEKISILCPTRGRPDLFNRMVISAFDRSSDRRRFEILAYVDDDDPKKDLYRDDENDGVRIVIGPPVRVGVAWNELARIAVGSLLMMGNDDLVFVTNDWDTKISTTIESLPWRDRMFVVWCDDGGDQPSRRCTFPIVSREWVDVLGYFAPTCFNFLYHDTWIHDIGRMIDRTYFIEDVLIEHRHFTRNKRLYDDTYRRHREGADNQKRRREDKVTFVNRVGERERDARKIITYNEKR